MSVALLDIWLPFLITEIIAIYLLAVVIVVINNDRDCCRNRIWPCHSHYSHYHHHHIVYLLLAGNIHIVFRLYLCILWKTSINDHPFFPDASYNIAAVVIVNIVFKMYIVLYFRLSCAFDQDTVV